MTKAPTAPAFIDIGANLTHDSFDADREEVIACAHDAGVARMIVTGADPLHSRAALALAEKYPGVLYATAGVHPHHADEFTAGTVHELSRLLARPEVVAAGECGLDYFRDLSPRPAQRAAFGAQIALAIEHGKPLFLHQRDAHEDFLAVLDDCANKLPTTVVHCFTDTAAELDAYLERGFYIGITGWICDERRGHHLLDLVARIPAGRLMLETDAPYLLPRDLEPRPATRRNEPQWLPHIAATVARARGETLEETAAHTTAAAVLFFGLDQK
ncbi:MAG: TatD family hydrolase [Gammaproteobacteria bacterium]